MPKVLFILLMSLIIASGPFAVGSFLPGLPSIAEYLGVGDNAVASLVSFYIFGLALGQLIGGPLLDRGDKKRIIIFGLLIYAASSALIGFAHNLHIIQTSRIFQAMGGGFAGVCVPALVRERATGNEAARLFSFIGLIMALAPAISPSVGAMILTMTGRWQNIFHFMALYALLVAFLTAVSLPKSPPQSLPPKTAIHRRYFAAIMDMTFIYTTFSLIFFLPASLIILLPATVLQLGVSQVNELFLSLTIVSFPTAIIFLWLYNALFESSSWETTPGKKLFALRVCDKDGKRITFGRASGRFWAETFSILTLGISYIMMAFTSKKQGLHDIVAKTLVVVNKS